MMDLTGLKLVVSGGAHRGAETGIGKAISLTFAKLGATLIILDKDRQAGQDTLDALGERPAGACFLEVDVTDEAQTRRCREELEERFSHIDGLVNCVGGGGPPTPFLETSLADWEGTLRRNVTSAFLCCQMALPLLLRSPRGGTITSIGSLHGSRYPGIPMAPYATAKAALSHLTRNIALEFAAHNIRCNTLLAGAVDTPQIRGRMSRRYGSENVEAVMALRDKAIPQGRCASVWDVANACAFLASPLAAHITGADIPLDGGASSVTVPSYFPDADRQFGAKA